MSSAETSEIINQEAYSLMKIIGALAYGVIACIFFTFVSLVGGLSLFLFYIYFGIPTILIFSLITGITWQNLPNNIPPSKRNFIKEKIVFYIFIIIALALIVRIGITLLPH